MGQCHSDFDVKSHHSGTSLPPTLSVSASRETEIGRAKPGNNLSYSPPVLTPRHRNVLVSKEVFTSLSPPQSPDMVVPFRGDMPQPEEEMLLNMKVEDETPHSPSPSPRFNESTFTESILIDVIDIQSKLPILPGSGYAYIVEKTSVAEKADQMVSPPVPFQKTYKTLASNNTKQLVLQSHEDQQKEAKTTEPAEPIPHVEVTDEGEAKIEAIFHSSLRVMFACYIIGIAFFFVMCNNAFTQKEEVAKAPVLKNNMDFLPAPAPDMQRKDRFHFVHEMKQLFVLLGEFSMQQDSHALLPLNEMKQLLGGSTERAVETIQAELEDIHDIVLI